MTDEDYIMLVFITNASAFLFYILLLVFYPQQTQEVFTQAHVPHWPKQTVDSKSRSDQRESQTHFVKRGNM